MKNRSSNLIDIFRFLAALSIIWHHSNYFELIGYQSENYLDLVKKIITWALPFFYFTTAYFSLITAQHSIKKLLGKIGKLSFYLLFYSFLWFLFKLLRFGTNLPPIEPVEFLVTGNNSHLYYLFDAIILGLFSIVFTIFPKRFSGITILVSYFFAEKSLNLIFFNRPSYIPTIFIAFFLASGSHKILLKKIPKLEKHIEVNIQKKVTHLLNTRYWLYAYLILPFVLFLFIPSTPIIIALTISLLFTLGLHTKLNNKNALIQGLSSWGQLLSLGIYLIHPFVTSVIDNILPKLLDIVPLHPAFIHMTIIISSSMISVGIVSWINKYFPFFIGNQVIDESNRLSMLLKAKFKQLLSFKIFRSSNFS